MTEPMRADEKRTVAPNPLSLDEQEPPLRIWAMHCPFRKTDSPVLGTFGASIQPVIIMKMETWKKLCARVPQLQTTHFEVGTYGDD